MLDARGKMIDEGVDRLIKYWAECSALTASLSAMAIANNDLDEAMRLINQARQELITAMGYRGAYKPPEK